MVWVASRVAGSRQRVRTAADAPRSETRSPQIGSHRVSDDFGIFGKTYEVSRSAVYEPPQADEPDARSRRSGPLAQWRPYGISKVLPKPVEGARVASAPYNTADPRAPKAKLSWRGEFDRLFRFVWSGRRGVKPVGFNVCIYHASNVCCGTVSIGNVGCRAVIESERVTVGCYEATSECCSSLRQQFGG